MKNQSNKQNTRRKYPSPRRQKSGDSFLRKVFLIFLLLVTIIGPPLLAYLVPPASPQPPNCEQKAWELTRTFNGESFFPNLSLVSGQDTAIRCTFDIQLQEDATMRARITRQEVMLEGVGSIPNLLPFFINKAKLMQVHQERDTNLMLNQTFGVHKLLKVTREDSLICDCEKGQCYFTVYFHSPQSLDEVFPEFSAIVRKYLVKTKSFQAFTQGKLDGYVNLGNVDKEISDQNQFQQELDATRASEAKLMELLDIDMIEYGSSKAIGYNPADYKVSIFQYLFIELIARHIRDSLQQSPRKQLEISCQGFTDSNAIQQAYAYPFPGKANKTYTAIVFDKKDDQQVVSTEVTHHASIAPHINDNNELSFARAYHGISLLSDFLKNMAPELWESERISFKYQGKGIDPDPTHGDAYKRRIEYHFK